MTFLALCMVAGGLLLLVFGGEVLLRGAVSLAARLGLSPLLVGMTVVAAATSMPEMVVAVAASLEDAPDIGIGNVIGSNTANILLILGTTAMLAPIHTQAKQVLRDGLAMLGATLLFTVLAVIGLIGRIEGVAMLILLIGYLAYSYRRERQQPASETEAALDEEPQGTLSNFWSLAFVTAGVALLVVGSKLLVEGAVDLARIAGVSEAAIGLTLVAIGTSLPELATAIVASYRRHPEIVLGNVIGSNLFNVMAIIPAMALTAPVVVAVEFIQFDVWVMAGVTVLCLVFMVTDWRFSRREGILFLVCYGAYMALLFAREQAAV